LPRPPHFFIERYTDSYAKEMKVFIDHLLNNKRPAVNANDGLRALDLALAAQQSATKKRVITVSI